VGAGGVRNGYHRRNVRLARRETSMIPPVRRLPPGMCGACAGSTLIATANSLTPRDATE
jgi:hypothetical protein